MLQPTDATAIPSMTHLVAHATFPNGSLAIRLRDALGFDCSIQMETSDECQLDLWLPTTSVVDRGRRG